MAQQIEKLWGPVIKVANNVMIPMTSSTTFGDILETTFSTPLRDALTKALANFGWVFEEELANDNHGVYGWRDSAEGEERYELEVLLSKDFKVINIKYTEPTKSPVSSSIPFLATIRQPLLRLFSLIVGKIPRGAFEPVPIPEEDDEEILDV